MKSHRLTQFWPTIAQNVQQDLRKFFRDKNFEFEVKFQSLGNFDEIFFSSFIDDLKLSLANQVHSIILN